MTVSLNLEASRATAAPDTGVLEKTPLERYVAPDKPSLVGLSRPALAEALAGIRVAPGHVKMRVQQLWHWIYVRAAYDFDHMTIFAKDLRP